MARYTHTFNPNGRFTEQDTGNVFEFSAVITCDIANVHMFEVSAVEY